MFANVVGVITRTRSDVVGGRVIEAGETIVGHVLVVASVGDGLATRATVIEQVEKRGDVGGNVVERVVPRPKKSPATEAI